MSIHQFLDATNACGALSPAAADRGLPPPPSSLPGGLWEALWPHEDGEEIERLAEALVLGGEEEGAGDFILGAGTAPTPPPQSRGSPSAAEATAAAHAVGGLPACAGN